MNLKHKVGIAALLASVSMGASAANFNYNYAQLGYETGDFEGLTLTGSFEINNQMFVLARYAAVTNDDAGFDLDYNEVSLGAGMHMPMDAKTDAVFSLSFINGEIQVPDFPFLDVDDSGVLMTAGVRHMVAPNIELAGNVYHTTHFDGDTGINGEVRYNINQQMSAGLSYTSSDAVDGLGLNFRMGF